MTVYIAHWTGPIDWDFIGIYSTREGAEYAIEREKAFDSDPDEFQYSVTVMEVK